MSQESDPSNMKLKYIDIPTIFQSYLKEEPFQNCISCEKYLLEGGTQYVIEKVIKGNSVEIEYAMCFDCVDKMRSVMSEESMKASQEFFEKNVNLLERYNKLSSDPDAGWEKWISNCLLSNKPVHELKEYVIHAHCDGKKMVHSVLPYMISAEAAEGMQELLSAKTKEELDRFTDEHFGLPPEWKEIFKRERVFI